MTSKSTLRKARHRERLFKEQRGLCYYCAKPMLLSAGTGTQRQPNRLATLEHIIPLANGGQFSPASNAVAACFQCNQQRGTRDARLFMLEKQGMLT